MPFFNLGTVNDVVYLWIFFGSDVVVQNFIEWRSVMEVEVEFPICLKLRNQNNNFFIYCIYKCILEGFLSDVCLVMTSVESDTHDVHFCLTAARALTEKTPPYGEMRITTCGNNMT